MSLVRAWKREIDLIVSDDTAQTRMLAHRALGSLTDATLQASTTDYREIPAAGVVDVSLGGFTRLRALLLETDGPVQLRVGATDADPLTVQPISAGNVGVAYLEVDSLPVIRLTNPSVTTAISYVLTAGGTL